MKKFVVIFGVWLGFGTNAQADVCYDIDEKAANKAVEIIRNQKEIYKYCSICPDTEPETIIVRTVQNKGHVYVNDEVIDVAHAYYKKGNKFVSLGVASGCIKAGEYNIKAELDDLRTIHLTKESNRELAKKQSQEIYEKCVDKAQPKENTTTSGMMEQNIKINDCLASVIKSEIESSFNPEQHKEMIETLKQIRKSVWKFYYNIYAENKYCYGACGTITNVLPFADEGKMLMEMLEKLIYLNLSKNGY